MKTNIFSRKSRTSAGLALALLLGGFGIAQAQPSPVGTWDCALSKPWMGTAYLTFGSDFTLSGLQIMTPPQSATNSYDVSRHTNVVGSAAIDGTWSFDTAGKVVGFYIETASGVECTTLTSVSTTNTVDIIDGGTVTNTISITNYVQNCVTNNLTNSVSFEASVKPGKKISIKATIDDGRRTSLKGVPATALPDISGSYYGNGRNDGAPFNEFFTLILARTSDPSSTNGYYLTGQGPGYTFSGFALLSAKSVSIFSKDDSTNAVLRAITGPININKGSATLKGYQVAGETAGTGDDKITYKVTKKPTPPSPPPAAE